jgi:hypothetical protein
MTEKEDGAEDWDFKYLQIYFASLWRPYSVWIKKNAGGYNIVCYLSLDINLSTEHDQLRGVHGVQSLPCQFRLPVFVFERIQMLLEEKYCGGGFRQQYLLNLDDI